MSTARRGMWTVALILVARWMWQSQAPQSGNVVLDQSTIVDETSQRTNNQTTS